MITICSQVSKHIQKRLLIFLNTTVHCTNKQVEHYSNANKTAMESFIPSNKANFRQCPSISFKRPVNIAFAERNPIFLAIHYFCERDNRRNDKRYHAFRNLLLNQRYAINLFSAHCIVSEKMFGTCEYTLSLSIVRAVIYACYYYSTC